VFSKGPATLRDKSRETLVVVALGVYREGNVLAGRSEYVAAHLFLNH
jgi:hypothetical protein